MVFYATVFFIMIRLTYDPSPCLKFKQWPSIWWYKTSNPVLDVCLYLLHGLIEDEDSYRIPEKDTNRVRQILLAAVTCGREHYTKHGKDKCKKKQCRLLFWKIYQRR